MNNKVAKLLEDSARHFGISTMNSISMQLIEKTKCAAFSLAITEDIPSQRALMNNNYTNAECSEKAAAHRYSEAALTT